MNANNLSSLVRRVCAWLGLSLLLTAHSSAAPWSVTSPDGTLVVTVGQDSTGTGGLSYAVRRGARTVIQDSPLGLTLAGDGGDFKGHLTFVRQANRRVEDRYVLRAAKRRDCVGRANETTLRFRNVAGREMELTFRAYDDGVAYRYRLLGTGAATVTGESSGFHLPVGVHGWAAHYNPNYEEFYPEGVVGRDFTQGEFAFPALFDVGAGQFALLAESAVSDTYCSSHWAGSADGTFRLTFPEPTVSGTLPWATPWRVVITGSLAQVVQSTLIETLAAPAVPGDARWVQPGRVAWSWWSQDTGDLAQQKRYVDFAHEMGWEYNLVDAGWTGWNNNNPGPQVTGLVNYGRARGVGILLWAHSHDLDTPEKRARDLPLWAQWGIKGIKVDFFDSDRQQAMRLREAILKTAWDNHLLVNFHGDQAPRGQDRTWPNFLTREGVRGAEYYKFGPYPTPTYNCTLPFTRNVLGPMDYTPVTFSTPNRKTTAAHELALSVVFQSGWQHFADSPQGYHSQPVAETFLKQVPADWDETRFLSGYPAQFCCLARRKGNAWFIGMNNAEDARTVLVPLDFLGRGSYRVELYQDGPAADSIARIESTVTSRGTLRVEVPAHGGFAARLSPAR